VCVCGAPHTHTSTDLIKYAATPPNQPQRCILTDYLNNYNFSKAEIKDFDGIKMHGMTEFFFNYVAQHHRRLQVS